MSKIPVGVVGLGSFGQNHLRVLRELQDVEIAGVVDLDPARTVGLDLPVFSSPADLVGRAAAAIVAVPTSGHAEVACPLLESGLDVLVEKPIAASLDEADELIRVARERRRILQVGHLERFNPAVEALQQVATLPLFFEIHRMSVFTPRSLDVDVVLDLMIHDVDILLSLTNAMPDEIRAAGIRILSEKADIANVRLGFPNGCVANLTASRASTEKVRKLRLFQPEEYISLDYTRQDAVRICVRNGEASIDKLPVQPAEPLRREIESFLRCVRTREIPRVSGEDGVRALEVCLGILAKIEEHGALVRDTIAAHGATTRHSVSS